MSKQNKIVVRYYLSGWRKVIADKLWKWNVPARMMCFLGFAIMARKKRPSAVMDNFGMQVRLEND